VPSISVMYHRESPRQEQEFNGSSTKRSKDGKVKPLLREVTWQVSYRRSRSELAISEELVLPSRSYEWSISYRNPWE
jgi:hypothetical protein